LAIVQNSDLMLTEIKQQPLVLEDTMSKNQRDLGLICNQLRPLIESGQIDQVMIVARGSSDNAAILGKYLFETKTGLPVSLAALSVVNLYEAPLNIGKTLVIAVTQSGATNEIIEFMTKIKSKAGYTIGITNEADSELVRLGLDGYLLCHAGKEQAVAATKSFTATIMLFYLLVAELAEDQQLQQELKTTPTLMMKTLSVEREIIKAIHWLAETRECVILARGYNYPIALEAGLKLQEVAYVRAKAFSGADFQHGPLAITQNGLPFLILKAAGSTYEGMDWLTKQVVQIGAKVLIISSNPGEEAPSGVTILKVPYCHELLTPFHFTIAVQLLANYTAKVLGINPNTPRWLHKVTATV
jgi:glutamine---fructose-6-phosphate transaminase (isomerizing)